MPNYYGDGIELFTIINIFRLDIWKRRVLKPELKK